MVRFAIMVIGDTQYLFDGSRTRADLLTRTFHEAHMWTEQLHCQPIVQAIHVGDITEHGTQAECDAACAAMQAGCKIINAAAIVVTGNHDVAADTDCARGDTPFRRTFGVGGALDKALRTFPAVATNVEKNCVEVDSSGYNSWRVLCVPQVPKIKIGVLALDWRLNTRASTWAERILRANQNVPTILVTHDIAYHRRKKSGMPCGPGRLTKNGEYIMNILREQKQVFLILGGHEWPSARVVNAGREIHAVNYQHLPYGGAGGARVYCFDTDRGECEVISFNAASGVAGEIMHSVAARRELALSRPEDQFRFTLPTTLGGSAVPWQAHGLELALDITGGSVKEFDLALPSAYVLEVQATLPAAFANTWQVLLARTVAGTPAPDGSPEPLAALSLSTENFLGWQAYVQPADASAGSAETWLNSHELPVGQPVQIVIAGGKKAQQGASTSGCAEAGMWINGDRVGRDDHKLSQPLWAGAWHWRLGGGEYAGKFTDTFNGSIQRLRIWKAAAN